MGRPTPFQLTDLVPSACVAANDTRLMLRQVLEQMRLKGLQMREIEIRRNGVFMQFGDP